MTVIALQLLHEGQQVTFAGPPSFREFVENKGLVFTPLPFDTEAVIKAHPRMATGGLWATLLAVPQLFTRTTEGQLSVLPELAQQADFILVGGVHTGVPSSAEYARIPWRWVLYTSILYPSSSHPPIIARLGRAPRFVNWLLWAITRVFINLMFRGPINRHRARLKLPLVDDVSEHILCRNPILAMEPELAPLPPEWPHADVIGYLDPGDGDPLPADVEAFLERGPAPIYIGFGSMPDFDPRMTTQLFVEATRRAGVRAVISRGWADFGAELPEHCIAVGPISHPRLFPDMAGIVHHGGAGTTAASARAGKPQLIVPHIADQFFFGNIVHELGVGAPPLRRTQLRVDLLAARMRSLLDDAIMRERAAQLGEKIRARPRPENLSRLLVQRAGASLPVLPIGRRVSLAPPPAR
jgi:vancomycin aglycone glucosyltransferase